MRCSLKSLARAFALVGVAMSVTGCCSSGDPYCPEAVAQRNEAVLAAQAGQAARCGSPGCIGAGHCTGQGDCRNKCQGGCRSGCAHTKPEPKPEQPPQPPPPNCSETAPFSGASRYQFTVASSITFVPSGEVWLEDCDGKRIKKVGTWTGDPISKEVRLPISVGTHFSGFVNMESGKPCGPDGKPLDIKWDPSP